MIVRVYLGLFPGGMIVEVFGMDGVRQYNTSKKEGAALTAPSEISHPIIASQSHLSPANATPRVSPFPACMMYIGFLAYHIAAITVHIAHIRRENDQTCAIACYVVANKRCDI